MSSAAPNDTTNQKDQSQQSKPNVKAPQQQQQKPNGISSGPKANGSVGSNGPTGPGIGSGKRPLVSLVKTDSDDPLVHQRIKLRQRHNQQGLIYMIVVFGLISAWIMGTYEVSFLWVFGLIVAIFVVWRGRMLNLTEEYLRDKELELHRRRALRQSETSEWFNFLLNRWWVFSESSITDILKRAFDPVLYDLKPAFIQNLELESFTLGSRTPHVKYLKVYEASEGSGGATGGTNRRAMTWSNVEEAPAGLRQASKYQLIIEANVGMQCDDFLAVFRATLGGKWVGMNVDIAVEKLNLSGLMHIVVNLDMDSPFPHISTVSGSFLEKPSVWFSMRLLKAVNIMEVPLIKSFLHQLIMNGLCEAMVDPGRVELNLESAGPTRMPSPQAEPKRLAQGVLTVSINCEYETSTDKNKKHPKKASPPANPLDYVEDMRYCEVRVGETKHITPVTPGHEPWSDHCSFHVFSTSTDKLTIELRSKVMLTDQKIARFDIPLSSLQLEQKKRGELVLQRKLEGQREGEQDVFLRMVLSATYTPLEDIEKSIVQRTPLGSTNLSDCVCGSLYVCVHGANDLLALDDNNLSDPYCFIYNGGKKVKSSHYVPRTRNPQWELATEIIIEDITKTMLSFIVYDWDGTSISDDDFLGSAHVLLSLDEPVFVRKKINLGFNLLSPSGSRQNDEDDKPNLGRITITAVFRPIPSVGTSTTSEQSSLRNSSRKSSLVPDERIRTSSGDHVTGGRGSISSSSQSAGQNHSKPRSLPPVGAGLLEVNIIQATELVAMDRNGFSDPFCEVKVNGKRHYVTSVKKRTLDPVWNETATLPLIKQDQTLEIVMWDHDAFFQKDFLGSLSFTLEDLKRYNADAQHDGWFKLNRITSGSVQIKFRVYGGESPDTTPEYFNNATPIQHSEKNVSQSSLAVPGAGSTLRHQSSSASSNNDPRLSGVSESYDDRNGQQPMRRAVSEARLNGDLSLADGQKNLSDHPDQLPPGYKMMTNDSYFFYGLTGQILAIKGLDDPTLNIYYKVRLVNVADSKKLLTSTSGQVIAKSAVFQPGPAAAAAADATTASAAGSSSLSRLEFDVDRGHGVKKQSRLVFDVKSGHFNHVAMRAFTLHELLGDADQEMTRWLPLEHGIEILVRLAHTGVMKVSDMATLGVGAEMTSQQQQQQRHQRSHRSLGGLFGGMRRRRNSGHSIEEEK